MEGGSDVEGKPKGAHPAAEMTVQPSALLLYRWKDKQVKCLFLSRFSLFFPPVGCVRMQFSLVCRQRELEAGVGVGWGESSCSKPRRGALSRQS